MSNSIRSRLEMGSEGREVFQSDRNSDEYQAVYDRLEPLVSICIATYNRCNLLFERAIRSSLGQTYPNIEVIVVGDCCTDETEARFGALRDPRVRFVNLPRRGDYPSDAAKRWFVAGTKPMNHALSLAQGDFITHLDDDDEHISDRVEKLVQTMQKRRADLIFHPFLCEQADGSWTTNQAAQFDLGQVTTSSIFYHRWFAKIAWDILAYRYHEPGDWNRLRKIRFLGADVYRHPEALLKHYREQWARISAEKDATE